MARLSRVRKARKLTQRAAAKLGIDQPKVAQVFTGRLADYSSEAGGSSTAPGWTIPCWATSAVR